MPRAESHDPWVVTSYAWEADRIVLKAHRTVDRGSVQSLPLEGEIRFRILPGKYCSGFIDFFTAQLMACPDRARGVSGQCERCRLREGFAACVRCTGRRCPPLSPAVEAYCRQPHYVYLACFGDDRVKVGTASGSRKTARLLEQGPLAAAYIASAPGPIAKQMEGEVAALGLPTRLTRREKRHLLLSRMSEAEAMQRVLDACVSAHTALAGYSPCLREPEPLATPDAARAARGVPDLDDVCPTPGTVLGGRVIGACGSVLVLDDGIGPVALDVAALRSSMIVFEPESPVTPRMKQLALL